jgi:hypothetical protein
MLQKREKSKMAVVFEAKICVNEDKATWFIELKDTQDGRIMLCNSLDELETNIETLGEDYGGHIDEVKWLKEENVPVIVMDELRVKMAEHREKIENERGEAITPLAQEEE